MESLEQKIEAVLFFIGEPMKISKISEIFSVSDEDTRSALHNLSHTLSERGVRLMSSGDEVMLGSAPEAGDIIETLIKEELNKDLGKAGLETLAIVLYLGPIARSRIDYIRGVNSNFILRNLLVRGLVEKMQNPKDQRSFLYKPTFDLLAHLGVSNAEDMPEYEHVRMEILHFEETEERVENDNDEI